MQTTTIMVAMAALLGLGCEASVRKPAKGAMLGALDAFEQPPEDAELARKLGSLAHRYVDKALAAEPPPSIEDISANVARGALREFAGTLAEQSPVIGQIAARASHEAARGLVREFGRDPETLALMDDAAFGAGRAMTSGVADELARRTDAWVGPDGRGPLGDAISALAARSAEYAVIGALAAVRRDFQSCGSNNGELCLADMTRSLSRSAGRGASEGVVREFDWLTAGVAFVAGLVAAILAGVAATELRNRRRMRI